MLKLQINKTLRYAVTAIFILPLIGFGLPNTAHAAPGEWTWVSGRNYASGCYSTSPFLNADGEHELPSPLAGSMHWKGSNGKHYIFGGEARTNQSYTNVMWEYDTLLKSWTHIHGSSSYNTNGHYGTINVSGANNMPGARKGGATWSDASGNFFLFGGYGYGESGTTIAQLNDFWMYNPTINQWTWLGGSKSTMDAGTPGTKGVESASNYPSARYDAGVTVLANGDVYLFGGTGVGFRHDLWKRNASNGFWTWISGSQGTNDTALAKYGTINVPASTNIPGGRTGSILWNNPGTDVLFLFGGYGAFETQSGTMNDMWTYDISDNIWTWIKGSQTGGSGYYYGQKGVENTVNNPLHRTGSNYVIEPTGDLWLYGGLGTPSSGGYTADLWRFRPSTLSWTWIGGNQAYGKSPYYGEGDFGTNQIHPGAVGNGIAWLDSNGNFVSFGGKLSYNTTSNDLWIYNKLTDNWTLESSRHQWSYLPFYETKNIPNNKVTPGGRTGETVWTDSDGKIWIYGGMGIGFYNSMSNYRNDAILNDLWSFDTASPTWTWKNGTNIHQTVPVAGAINQYGPNYTPGSRYAAAGWNGDNDTLYLFGGSSNNDMWKYRKSTNEWALVNAGAINAVYGTQGVPATSNIPGKRSEAAYCKGIDGNFYLFGGTNYTASSPDGVLNDLWKYNPVTAEWTWLKGANVKNGAAIHGNLGEAGTDFTPGARSNAVIWLDKSGNIWLFGGKVNAANNLSDLWKYDVTDNKWALMKGSITPNQNETATGINTPNASNNPAAKYYSYGWTSDSGSLYLFGGLTDGSATNDLWKFDIQASVWIKLVMNSTPLNYGMKNISAPANFPGARYDGRAVKMPNGTIYLYGGKMYGTDSFGISDEVWKYENPVENSDINDWQLFQ